MREYDPTISRLTFPSSVNSATVCIGSKKYRSARGDPTQQSPNLQFPAFSTGLQVLLLLIKNIIEAFKGICPYDLPIYVHSPALSTGLQFFQLLVKKLLKGTRGFDPTISQFIFPRSINWATFLQLLVKKLLKRTRGFEFIFPRSINRATVFTITC